MFHSETGVLIFEGIFSSCAKLTEGSIPMRKRLNFFLALITILIVVISHNNCTGNSKSPVEFFSNSKGLASVDLNVSGNGDGYLGKPEVGDYIRTFPDYKCTDSSVGVQGAASVNSVATVLHEDNCISAGYTLSFADSRIDFSQYNKDYIGIGSAIYEILPEQGLNTDLPVTEAWCRWDQSDSGMDVVIKLNNQAQNPQAKIYLGSKIAATSIWSSQLVPFFGVSRTSSASDYTYRSEDFSLKIDIGTGGIFKGHVTTRVDGKVYDYELNCRVANSAPVLVIDTTSLAGLWQFENTFRDSSGKNNDASLFGAGSIISFVNSIFGVGLNYLLNNNSQYLVAGPSPSTNDLRSVTISAWVNASDTSGGGILEKTDSVINPAAGWRFGIGGSSDKLYFQGGFSGGTLIAASAPVMLLNQWSYLTVTWDGSPMAANVRFYSNGVPLGQSTTIDGIGLANSDAAQSLKIGYANDGNASYGFKGQMDEVSLWSRVLTDQEILQLYQKGLISQ